MTSRAKKRIGLLAILLILVAAGGWIAVELRESTKRKNASLAKQNAQVAIENGDWPEALSQLSVAASVYRDDAETLIQFADLRSRVTAENNQHLITALRIFRDAYAKSKAGPSVDATSLELQILALEGCADMELALGQLARAGLSCEQILAIDPSNTYALEKLAIVKTAVGDHIPESEDLWRKGDRSLDEWVETLRKLTCYRFSCSV